MGRKRPATLRELSSNAFLKMIICVITNMDDIRQERHSEGPVLNLNKGLK